MSAQRALVPLGPAPRPLIDILDLSRVTALYLLCQRALDERVDVAVEHLLRVAALRPRAQILHQLVGLQNIGTDLVAPADLGFGGGRSVGLLLAFFQLELVEARLQHGPGDAAVLDLRAFLLARHDDAGGNVGDPHGRIGGVDVLTAGAGRAISIHPAIAFFDFDLDVFVDDRVDPYAGKGGVPTRIRVIGGDAHQPMHARFSLEPPVGVLTLDNEGRRLDTRLFSSALLDDRHLVFVVLGPTRIHAREHLGPVLALRAAGT